MLNTKRKVLRNRNEWSGMSEIIWPMEANAGKLGRQSTQGGRSSIYLRFGEAMLTVRARRQHSIQTSGSQSVLLEPATSAFSWECVLNANSWVPSQTY